MAENWFATFHKHTPVKYCSSKKSWVRENYLTDLLCFWTVDVFFVSERRLASTQTRMRCSETSFAEDSTRFCYPFEQGVVEAGK